MKTQVEIHTDRLAVEWWRRAHEIRPTYLVVPTSHAASQSSHSKPSASVAMLVAVGSTSMMDMRLNYAFATAPDFQKHPG